jgi:hypothetical protein
MREFGGGFNRESRSFEQDIPDSLVVQGCTCRQNQDIFANTSPLLPTDLVDAEEEQEGPEIDPDFVQMIHNHQIDTPVVPFFGKASGAHLIRTALEVMGLSSGPDDIETVHQAAGIKRPEYWTDPPVRSFSFAKYDSMTLPNSVGRSRRG